MSEVTVTLPVWLPLTNLALSFVAATAYAYLLVRAIRRREMRETSTRLITLMVGAAIAVLVGGAMSQLGLLSPEVWTVVGTGGRVVVAVGLVTIATLPGGTA